MVAHPDIPGSDFNEEYYVEKHLPMVYQHWAQYGLLDWKVIRFDKSSDGARTYLVAACMTWKSVENFNQAMASDSMGMLVDDLQEFQQQAADLLEWHSSLGPDERIRRGEDFADSNVPTAFVFRKVRYTRSC